MAWAILLSSMRTGSRPSTSLAETSQICRQMLPLSNSDTLGRVLKGTPAAWQWAIVARICRAVAGRHKNALLPGFDEFGNSSNGRTDDGQARSHRFHHRRRRTKELYARLETVQKGTWFYVCGVPLVHTKSFLGWDKTASAAFVPRLGNASIRFARA
jgi:hypothetical protein